jgi:hypothetical protein
MSVGFIVERGKRLLGGAWGGDPSFDTKWQTHVYNELQE